MKTPYVKMIYLKGGITGLFSSVAADINKELSSITSSKEYRVVQIIPAKLDILQMIWSMILLCFTLGMYTTYQAYLVLVEPLQSSSEMPVPPQIPH